jgi:uncharacterized protein (TIGR03382 family)
MYVSWTPWMGQRRPSLDDKLGLCSIYPAFGDECTVAGGCAPGETCTATAAGDLCELPIDPIGTPCNYDRIECGDFCLFTSSDLSTGYCSRFCDDNGDCPLTHHCDLASAGSATVKVCFAGAQPPPPDAATACTVDDDCATGLHCTTMNACSFDCRTDDDCAGAVGCDDRGRCQPTMTDASGCCGTGPASPSLPVALALTVLGLMLRRRR